MRGLPPPPLDVARLTQDVYVDGLTSSTGFWLQSPGIGGATIDELNAIITQWFNTCLPNLLNVMHNEAIATTCRLSVLGIASIESAPPNHGGWTGATAAQVAMGWKWATGQGGRKGWAVSYLPAAPSIFISNHYQLNDVGIGNLQASGTDMLNSLNALVGIGGAPVRVGTVHRAAAGAPLSASLFAEYLGVVPTFKVVTCARRIPRRRSVSPS